jgi:anthranilate phosphoribosyltransferase
VNQPTSPQVPPAQPDVDASARLAEVGGWPEVLATLVRRSDLSPEQVSAALETILSGSASPGQIGAFALALRTKGESAQELVAALAVMERYSVTVPLNQDQIDTAICTCGTGGDRSGSINISTIAAFVAAGAGALVCKHGGRAASSLAGSADVLEALGVAVEITPAGVVACLEAAGVAFCFAPRFHPAMRHAGPVRRELGIATLFNFLGPLANPGRVRRQLVGVSDPAMAPVVADVLAARNTLSAVVVRGDDGLDEISTTAPSTLRWVSNGTVTTERCDPAQFGLATVTATDLKGGDAPQNAEAARRVLAGDEGPHRDIVVLNAGASLVIAGRAASIAEGIALAVTSIDSGAAAQALTTMAEVSQQHRV